MQIWQGIKKLFGGRGKVQAIESQKKAEIVRAKVEEEISALQRLEYSAPKISVPAKRTHGYGCRARRKGFILPNGRWISPFMARHLGGWQIAGLALLKANRDKRATA